MGATNANGSWPSSSFYSSSSSSSTMGKSEEEQQQPLPLYEDPPRNAACRCRCFRIRKLVGVRCVLVLVVSVAVFLSAAFWLPPFISLADRRNLHGGSRFKGGGFVSGGIVRSVSVFGFGGNEVLGFRDLGGVWEECGWNWFNFERCFRFYHRAHGTIDTGSFSLISHFEFESILGLPFFSRIAYWGHKK